MKRLAAIVLALMSTATMAGNLYRANTEPFNLAQEANRILPPYMAVVFVSDGFEYDFTPFLDKKSMGKLGVSIDEVLAISEAPRKGAYSKLGVSNLHITKHGGQINQFCEIRFTGSFNGKRTDLFRTVFYHELMHCRTMDYAMVKRYKKEFTGIKDPNLVGKDGSPIALNVQHYLLLEIMAETMLAIYEQKVLDDPAFAANYRKFNAAMKGSLNKPVDYALRICGEKAKDCPIETGVLMKNLMKDPIFIAKARESMVDYVAMKPKSLAHFN